MLDMTELRILGCCLTSLTAQVQFDVPALEVGRGLRMYQGCMPLGRTYRSERAHQAACSARAAQLRRPQEAPALSAILFALAG